MQENSPNLIAPDVIVKAYALGYFPMARSRNDKTVVWVLPDIRGALRLSQATAPKRLIRTLRSERFNVTFNRCFRTVISACGESSKGREDTWINETIEQSYNKLHELGYAHSMECWRDGKLVGGLYGVSIGGVFCGESMFSRETDASKVTMLHLIARLKHNGFALLDTQFHTEHLAQFGVAEWPNEAYQNELKTLIGVRADFTAGPAQFSSAAVLQSITQTS